MLAKEDFISILSELGSIFKYSNSVELITTENAIQALTKD